jgi:hypothetical protein
MGRPENRPPALPMKGPAEDVHDTPPADTFGVHAMIRRIVCFCFLLTAGSVFPAGDDFLKKTSLELLDTYCPDGSRIVRMCMPLYPKARDTEFTSMIDGKDEAACVNGLNTVVHEENHTAHAFMGRDILRDRFGRMTDLFYEYDYFYLGDSRFTLMARTPTFPSLEMVPEFPDHLRTFRFDTYVNTTDTMQSTQMSGIYGLLDEMNSYYQGTRASYELLGWFEKKGRNAEWHDWFQGVNGTLYGCLEFRLYILKYLMYARKHHAGKYWTILGNRAWCYTFLETDRNVSELIQSYANAKPAVFKRLAGYGWTVSEDDSYVSITKAGRTVRHMNFLGVLKLLADEMKKPEYLEVEKTIREWAGDWNPESIYGEIETRMAEGSGSPAWEEDSGGEDSGQPEPEEPSEPDDSAGSGGGIQWQNGGFSDAAGDAGHAFIDLTAASVLKRGNVLVIRMDLVEFPKRLAFCQNVVEENRQEYRWAAFFDLEGDGTGDHSVELGSFKMPGCAPAQGDPLTLAQASIWDLEGDGGSLSDAAVRSRREGNSLVLEIPSCPWIASVGKKTRIRFETYYTDGRDEDADRMPD